MQISNILSQVDLGAMALPEFQRGYVWNRDQVRELITSLYHRYPIGSLLVWSTRTDQANARGDANLQPGYVDLILDGQQRITSLYGVIRGRPPEFFQGNTQAFTGLYFNLASETFKFYSPLEMKADPLWVDVTELMQQNVGPFTNRLLTAGVDPQKLGDYITRLNNVHAIQSIDLHVEKVAGDDKTIEVVVDIFNKVNSGGTSMGARFYPMLYLLTRVLKAHDWGHGALELNAHMLGKLNWLQVHHIFPKALLYRNGYARGEVNAIANFCFLTQQTNLEISDRQPEEYFEAVERRYPGALASQWVPMDRELWTVARYRDFLAARRELLAQAANNLLDSLLVGAARPEPVADPALNRAAPPMPLPGSADEEELQLIAAFNTWVTELGLPQGEVLYELADLQTGAPLAIIDLAWPRGLQEGLSQPVALLLNEAEEIEEIVNQAGYRFFTNVDHLRAYVEQQVLSVPAVETY